MKKRPTSADIEKLERDFAATKTIGNGKHRKVVPDARRRLRAATRYLRWRLGPPTRLVFSADGHVVILPAASHQVRGAGSKSAQ